MSTIGIPTQVFSAGKSLISGGNPLEGATKGFKNIFGMERATSRPSQFDAGTRSLTDSMLARSRGETPSFAETQTKNMLDTNLSNTVSAIRSAPGISPSLKARMISRSGERTGSEIAKQGAEARIAEQIGTERALGGILTSARGTDIGAFEKEQDRRNFLKDFARGAGSAIAPGATK